MKVTKSVAIKAIDGIDGEEAALGNRLAGGAGAEGAVGTGEEEGANVSGGRLLQSGAIGRLTKHSVGQISGQPHSRGV